MRPFRPAGAPPGQRRKILPVPSWRLSRSRGDGEARRAARGTPDAPGSQGRDAAGMRDVRWTRGCSCSGASGRGASTVRAAARRRCAKAAVHACTRRHRSRAGSGTRFGRGGLRGCGQTWPGMVLPNGQEDRGDQGITGKWGRQDPCYDLRGAGRREGAGLGVAAVRVRGRGIATRHVGRHRRNVRRRDVVLLRDNVPVIAARESARLRGGDKRPSNQAEHGEGREQARYGGSDRHPLPGSH